MPGIIPFSSSPRQRFPFSGPSKRLLTNGRIVGGTPVTIQDYPYQLSLRFSGSHNCGASILSSRYALTAAHCIQGLLPEVLSVRAGSSFINWGGQIIPVSRVFMHPSFSYATMDFDIAVIELAWDIQLGNTASPIEMADPGTVYAEGTEGTITGWGTLSEGALSLPAQLQAVNVPLVTPINCFNIYANRISITNRMICAGTAAGGRDSCQGDSGGPLVVDGKLAGIVSWGFGCGRPNEPGVYANVAALRTFVNQFTGL